MQSINEAIVQGEKIARFSASTLTVIGIVEIFIGSFTASIGLTADGVESLADATISFIISIGLRISKRAPDDRFHFGYLKVESLSSLIASFLMIAIGSVVAYFSYLRFLAPQAISSPIVALITLLVAGIIAIYQALLMRRIAKKHKLLSLKTGAYNALKDASASFVVFGTVLAASLGIPQMDAIGGIIIAGYVYSVAYVSIKEASLVLVDACNCEGGLIDMIKGMLEEKYPIKVEDIRLRNAGPYLFGEMNLAADGNLTLNQVGELKSKIRSDLIKHVDGLGEISIIVHSKGSSEKEKQ